MYYYSIADTHLSGNDIIQKYSVSLLLFIFHGVLSVSWELHGQWKTSAPENRKKPQENETAVQVLPPSGTVFTASGYTREVF